MHEFEEDDDSAVSDDPQQRLDVMRWRKAERARLRTLRRALPARQRRDHAVAIETHLWDFVERQAEPVVALYWPIHGEPDLRQMANRIEVGGGRCALPVVKQRKAPLVFRCWTADTPLRPGVWGIPEPAAGADIVPTVVIAPLLGFDDRLYRLGNGGGYYDRTLGAAKPKPFVIGVGYDMLRIPTIFPQPHDIPMDVIVTETGFRDEKSPNDE